MPDDIVGSGTVGTDCVLELSRVHGTDAYPYLREGDLVHLEGGPLGAIEAHVVAGRRAVPLRQAANDREPDRKEAGR